MSTAFQFFFYNNHFVLSKNEWFWNIWRHITIFSFFKKIFSFKMYDQFFKCFIQKGTKKCKNYRSVHLQEKPVILLFIFEIYRNLTNLLYILMSYTFSEEIWYFSVYFCSSSFTENFRVIFTDFFLQCKLMLFIHNNSTFFLCVLDDDVNQSHLSKLICHNTMKKNKEPKRHKNKIACNCLV